jgi:hypothetical protein
MWPAAMFVEYMHIQQNSINLAQMGPDMCPIIEHAGLPRSTYTDQSTYT